MGLNNKQKDYIKEVIINCLRDKFQHYKPESSYMPFHYRLLGKDRMALYSFIQSFLPIRKTKLVNKKS
jgi:type II restriction enzyme